MLVFLIKMRDDCGDPLNCFASEISTSKIYENTTIVLTAMKKNFIRKYMDPNPSKADAIREARLFHNRTGFPRLVFAAIDGTHIKVLRFLL